MTRFTYFFAECGLLRCQPMWTTENADQLSQKLNFHKL